MGRPVAQCRSGDQGPTQALARSAIENYAGLIALVYDFDLTREIFFNDGKNNFTFKTYPYKGRLYWNEGAMR